MTENDKRIRISWPGCLRGAREIAPIAMFAVPFGIAFGTAAIQANVAPGSVIGMSALMFAGAAQFAILDFWVDPLDFLALFLVVFAVNARLILMGAALYPWMRHLPWGQRHLAAALISDANWAHAMEAYAKGHRDFGILVGSGIFMWACWQLGIVAGIYLGEVMTEPRRFGLDAVMVIFFACILVPVSKRGAVLWPWVAAAATAIAATSVLPPGWHVLAGGLAGGLVGALGRD